MCKGLSLPGKSSPTSTLPLEYPASFQIHLSSSFPCQRRLHTRLGPILQRVRSPTDRAPGTGPDCPKTGLDPESAQAMRSDLVYHVHRQGPELVVPLQSPGSLPLLHQHQPFSVQDTSSWTVTWPVPRKTFNMGYSMSQ